MMTPRTVVVLCTALAVTFSGFEPLDGAADEMSSVASTERTSERQPAHTVQELKQIRRSLLVVPDTDAELARFVRVEIIEADGTRGSSQPNLIGIHRYAAIPRATSSASPTVIASSPALFGTLGDPTIDRFAIRNFEYDARPFPIRYAERTDRGVR